MSARDLDSGWFSRERVLTLLLCLATLLSLYLCYRLVLPFIPALAIAVALAVATDRPYRSLRSRVKRDTAAAALAVVLVTLLILVPLALLGHQMLKQGIHALNRLSDEGFDWRQAVGHQPYMASLLTWLESRLDLQGQILRAVGVVASWAGNLLSQSVTVVMQLALALFVLFFLYRDREKALQMLRYLLPLNNAEQNLVLARAGNTIRATVNGALTVALVQATLAGLIYTVLSVRAPLLWGAATGIASFVPVFGTSLVWVPASIYLFISGSWVKAVILIVWSIFAVASIDNLLYPTLVGEKLRIHTVPTVFAILGAIVLTGPVGVILGPLVLAITIALLDIWKWRTAGGHTAEEAVTPGASTPRPAA